MVVASRLPVDRTKGPDGAAEWRTSPGGLVGALEPVMREAEGAWIGWSGDAGPAPGPFHGRRPGPDGQGAVRGAGPGLLRGILQRDVVARCTAT